MQTKEVKLEHIHNTEEEFKEIVEKAKDDAKKPNSHSSSNSLYSDAQLIDNYQPEEHKDRSRSISSILHLYEQSYRNKIQFQRRYRQLLFWGCSMIIMLFSIALILILGYSAMNASSMDIAGIVAAITSAVSLVVAILEIIYIITKYCFPKNDEEYIIKIVESVQENDLAQARELNRTIEARQQHRGDPSDTSPEKRDDS